MKGRDRRGGWDNLLLDLSYRPKNRIFVAYGYV